MQNVNVLGWTWVGLGLGLGWTMKTSNCLIIKGITVFGLDYIKFQVRKYFVYRKLREMKNVRAFLWMERRRGTVGGNRAGDTIV